MPDFNRQFWRAAGRIEQHLLSRNSTHHALQWDQLLVDVPRLTQRLDLATERGWNESIRYFQQLLLTRLTGVKYQIEQALNELAASGGYEAGPIQSAIYDELVALSDEFERFELDLKHHTIAITTEPIVLEDMDFGRFRIKLDWTKCGSGSAPVYTVTALTPNRPSSNSSVTHPHVINDHLCEGDATSPLLDALQSGRLCDFFQIILAVLCNYNAGSPYVTLDQWDGVNCHSCGSNASQDSCHCSYCDATVCESCSHWCDRCRESRCEFCMIACAGCGERCCPDCLRQCVKCLDRVCPNCRNPPNICEACEHAMQSANPEPSVPSATNASQSEPEIQPVGVGQTAVLA